MFNFCNKMSIFGFKSMWTTSVVAIIMVSVMGVQSAILPEENVGKDEKVIRFSSSATDTGGWIPKTGVHGNDWTVSANQIQSVYSSSNEEVTSEANLPSLASFTNVQKQGEGEEVYRYQPKVSKPIVIQSVPVALVRPVSPQWVKNRHIPRMPGISKPFQYMRRRQGPDFFRRSKRKSTPVLRLPPPSPSRMMKDLRRRRITFPTPTRRFSLDNSGFSNPKNSIKSSIFRFEQGSSNSRQPHQGLNMSPSPFFQQQQTHAQPPLIMTRLRPNHSNEPFPCVYGTESMGRNGEWCIEV